MSKEADEERKESRRGKRVRNSAVRGQLPIKSRQLPLGLTTLSPESRSKVRASNFSLKVVVGSPSSF